VVNDQIGSPTYAADLAKRVIVQSPKWIPGIYNYSNEGKSVGMICFGNKKLGGYNVRSMESSEAYPTPANDLFSFWIRRRLKLFMALLFQIIRRV
jgi:dTDP-4-dehydrorhamnose reductase